MASTAPFIDPESGGLDLEQIKTEAYPLVGLIALVAGVALIPFVFTTLLARLTPIAMLLTVLTQFVLAVGTGIVLLYVIARAIQLADADR